MGHLVQMAGLAVQNFVSAAVGIAVAVALVRGFARSRPTGSGNFWVDLVRGVRADPAAARGRRGRRARGRRASSRTSPAAPTITTLAGGAADDPGRPGGVARRRSRSSAPTAAASTTPTPRTRSRTRPRCTNLLRDLPAAGHPVLRCPAPSAGWSATSGRATRSSPSMGVLWAGRRGRAIAVGGRAPAAPAPQAAGAAMEGKEVRFGVPASALFAASTTLTSTGAVNSFHDSLHRARRRRARCST